MIKNRVFSLVAVLLVFAVVLSACSGSKTTNTDTPGTEQTTDKTDTNSNTETNGDSENATDNGTDAGTDTPSDSSRVGANLDSITIIGVEEAAALTQLEAGAIDVFAGSLPGSYLKDIEATGMNYASSTGTSYEIMLNNADTTEAGMFNPFSIREVREAMNWLIDRDYIVKEIFNGAAIPRQFAVSSSSPDYAKYIEYARVEEAKYAYNKDKAVDQISEAMTAAGIEKNADGKYVYEGEPIVLKFYIRTEDGLRQPIGDYVSNELEGIGFTIDRVYRVSSEASPVVFGSDPTRGEWNLYTGAWGASELARDTGIYFHDYASPDSRYGYNPWSAFKISDEYNDVLTKLANNDFETMEERKELFKTAFEEHNYWATRIWLADGLTYAVWNNNVSTSYNLSAGVDNDQMTGYTMQFTDKDGGDLVWGNSSAPFVNPVNPIAGTNWTYDSQYLQLTRDYIAIGDPFTGLKYPKRIESAEITVKTGLPVAKTYDWVDLKFEDEIKVPEDAMIDWDVDSSTWINANADYLATQVTKKEEEVAKAEAAITEAEAAVAAATDEEKADKEAELSAAQSALTSAQEDLEAAKANAETGYLTAKRKTVVTFPEDMSGFTWHDGTPVTAADIMMTFIMKFETAYEESPYYDAYVAPAFLSTQPYFKGWRITSESPLTVELYKDDFFLDAEGMVSPLEIGWTYDSSGAQANWAAIAIGNRVIESGKAAYAEGTADASDTVEWLNYIDGPSLEYLATATDELIAEDYIPFEATMSKYVSPEAAKTAYENTKKFYETNGHFVIGCGPYYISKVLSTEGSITLSKYEGYDEPSDKWSFLSEPKIASIELDGPASVTAGTSATFDVFISDPSDEPYANADIDSVKYLLYSASGEIVEVQDVTSDTDGMYSIELSSESIDKLGTGSCKIEVVVAPKAVAAPTIHESEFIVE